MVGTGSWNVHSRRDNMGEERRQGKFAGGNGTREGESEEEEEEDEFR